MGRIIDRPKLDSEWGVWEIMKTRTILSTPDRISVIDTEVGVCVAVMYDTEENWKKLGNALKLKAHDLYCLEMKMETPDKSYQAYYVEDLLDE